MDYLRCLEIKDEIKELESVYDEFMEKFKLGKKLRKEIKPLNFNKTEYINKEIQTMYDDLFIYKDIMQSIYNKLENINKNNRFDSELDSLRFYFYCIGKLYIKISNYNKNYDKDNNFINDIFHTYEVLGCITYLNDAIDEYIKELKHSSYK